jgi:hypothetical protein
VPRSRRIILNNELIELKYVVRLDKIIQIIIVKQIIQTIYSAPLKKTVNWIKYHHNYFIAKENK